MSVWARSAALSDAGPWFEPGSGSHPFNTLDPLGPKDSIAQHDAWRSPLSTPSTRRKRHHADRDQRGAGDPRDAVAVSTDLDATGPSLRGNS